MRRETRNPGRGGIPRFVIGAVVSVAFALAAACGNATDGRFGAQSDDERQPQANAVIGTPDGVLNVAADGAVTFTPNGASNSTSSTSAGSSASAPGSSATGAGSIGAGSSGGAGSASSGTVSLGGGTTGVTSGTGTGTSTDIGVSSSSATASASSGASSEFFGDGGPAPDGGVVGGFGFWHFDDCSPDSHFLIDSSGEGANAQQALGADCVPGISGLGVDISSVKGIIQVPDEPQFTLTNRVGVAAWVNPNTVSGDQPIVIKRLNNKTAFSLGIHNGNIQMSVVLTTGTTVISQAPISPGVWTHVAGMFDGTFVYLFINGQQFGQVYGAGTIRDVFAPLRFGATTQSQHFDGIIDEVFVTTEAITSSTLTSLACISKQPTLSVSPATSGPVTFDTTVNYDVAVTNNDVGFCASRDVEAFFEGGPVGFSSSFDSNFTTVPPSVPPQAPQSTTFVAQVTSSEIAEPGVVEIPFIIETFTESPFFSFQELFGSLTYDLIPPSGCFVFVDRELMITDTSVVDDPIRTFGQNSGGVDGGILIPSGPDGGISSPEPVVIDDASPPVDAGGSPSLGVWTLGQLLTNSAPTPAQAPAMVLALFQHWLTDQTVNTFDVPARPEAQQLILDIWPKTPTGDLDLTQAPFTLQAIVARVDLRNLAANSAGEGRFVFGLNSSFGFAQEFTLILEYNLPAQTQDDVLAWANRWHSLSSLPFPSPEYNAALEAITTQFTSRNASPTSINGSALNSLRTNDFTLVPEWELREFELDPTTGFFDQNPTKETPDLSFNGTQAFADFVNANAATIIAEVPGASGNNVTPLFEGVPFQAGSSINQLPSGVVWNGPGIIDPDARFHASENTCNGCHGSETGTAFLQITPRSPGSVAILSPFLTGTTVVDPFSGQVRTLNDLARRQADLESLVCTGDAGAPNATGQDSGGSPPFDAEPPPPFDAAPPSPLDAGVP